MVFTPRGLMVMSVAVGAVSVATLALSVATDAWLFTTESYEIPGNTTGQTGQTGLILIFKAQLGLWKVCLNTDFSKVPPMKVDGNKFCESYDAIHSDTERIESQQTSFAIMRATRVAAMFPVVALVLITIAVILGIIGNIRRDIKTLLAAVIAILGGLTLAVGIILYISAINDEVGHRLKGKEGKQFAYEYGWSFFFAGMSFMIAEGTAVVLVTQFMQRNSTKDDMVRIIPGLEDKFDQPEKDDNEDGTTNPTIVL